MAQPTAETYPFEKAIKEIKDKYETLESNLVGRFTCSGHENEDLAGACFWASTVQGYTAEQYAAIQGYHRKGLKLMWARM